MPVIIGTFFVAVIYKGSLIAGFQAVFNANLLAAKELFSIFLIISLMIALLNSLKDLGADKRLIGPIEKVMVNGHISYLVLMVTTYVISLFSGQHLLSRLSVPCLYPQQSEPGCL